MAKVELLVPKILKWEGGFVDDPLDQGGATNKGVTIETFRQVFGERKTVADLKVLTIEQFSLILKKYYWDRWKADFIQNQSVANILVDWVWASGKWGIMIPQKMLVLKDDGLVGVKTLEAIANRNQAELFEQIVYERKQFVKRIVQNKPEQIRFLKGWVNRINDFKFEA